MIRKVRVALPDTGNYINNIVLMDNLFSFYDRAGAPNEKAGVGKVVT